MAIRVIKAAAPAWFKPASQKGSDDPAEFKVEGLTGSGQAQVATEVSITQSGDLTFSAKGIELLFRLGLRDWRGVVDEHDNPVEFAGKTPHEIQNLLHYNDQIAIASEIFSRSFLAMDDKKKS